MAKKTSRCNFCGKGSRETGPLVEGAVKLPDNTIQNAYICAECIARSSEILETESNKIKLKNRKVDPIPTPRSVVDHLDQFVIGQNSCKRKLAIAVTNHYKRLIDVDQAVVRHPLMTNSDLANVAIDKSNVLLIGPTGSGKTLLAKSLAEFLNVPFAIGDATSITEAGYVGEDVENLLLKLLRAADFDLERAERGIIFIDEIDKLHKTGGNTSITRDVSGEGVQQSLLKMIEGTDANIPPQGGRKHPEQQYIQMDTTNILFIVGGSFVGLDDIIKKRSNKNRIGFGLETASNVDDEIILKNKTLHQVEVDDLVQYGLIPELVGRLPIIAVLDELSLDDMVRVLIEPKHAITKQFRKLCLYDNVELEFTSDALLEMAKQARIKGTGARGLRSVIESVMEEVMFDMPQGQKIVIDADVVLKLKSIFSLSDEAEAA